MQHSARCSDKWPVPSMQESALRVQIADFMADTETVHSERYPTFGLTAACHGELRAAFDTRFFALGSP